jgi:hypothetical protein
MAGSQESSPARAVLSPLPHYSQALAARAKPDSQQTQRSVPWWGAIRISPATITKIDYLNIVAFLLLTASESKYGRYLITVQHVAGEKRSGTTVIGQVSHRI